MRTWEMIKMLTENPTLEFVRVGDGKKVNLLTKIENGIVVDKYVHGTDGECVSLLNEWKIVTQPVDFMTAVKAFAGGKKIRCNLFEVDYFYKKRCECADTDYDLVTLFGSTISAREITHGTWYIEE